MNEGFMACDVEKQYHWMIYSISIIQPAMMNKVSLVISDCCYY